MSTIFVKVEIFYKSGQTNGIMKTLHYIQWQLNTHRKLKSFFKLKSRADSSLPPNHIRLPFLLIIEDIFKKKFLASLKNIVFYKVYTIIQMLLDLFPYYY